MLLPLTGALLIALAARRLEAAPGPGAAVRTAATLLWLAFLTFAYGYLAGSLVHKGAPWEKVNHCVMAMLALTVVALGTAAYALSGNRTWRPRR